MKYTKQIILCLTILLLFPGIQLWAENYALEFDGTDDFMSLGTSISATQTNMSYGFWINFGIRGAPDDPASPP